MSRMFSRHGDGSSTLQRSYRLVPRHKNAVSGDSGTPISTSSKWSKRLLGMSGFHFRGEGVNRAPQNWGGGFGKRAQLTGTINQSL